MDEDHLIAAFRYVALNPVKAGLVKDPADWPWSSTKAHIARLSTRHVDVEPALSRLGDFAAFVAGEPGDQTLWADILKAELIGRPVGAEAWIRRLETQLGRDLSPRKRGPKPKAAANNGPDMRRLI